MFKKLFKKIAKGIKKVAKKIVKVQKKVWKGIKKVGGKVMKAINKAGIVGQLGLMLIMPYAMSGLGSLIGNAAGGLSATWNGFGNWASTMMGKSNVFAKAVGGIARGVYHAGATAGKIISGASKFIDNGFKAIANATGLPNPIEGFSNAVKSGYTNSFQATNNFLFSGTQIGATPEQLAAAGVQPTTTLPKINMEAMEFGEAPKFEAGESLETYLERTKPGGVQMPDFQQSTMEYDISKGQFVDTSISSQQIRFNPNTGQYEKITLRNLPDASTPLSEQVKTDLGISDPIDYVSQVSTPRTQQSTLEKWGERAQDFVESKAGEYAEKWASNRINEAVYGEQETDTSIGFNNWEEIGKTISVQNFFQRGDTYTPSLAAFYDEAENAFSPPRQGGFA
jgi:hypothetical protein